MRIHNSLRNNFLGLMLLLVFVLPAISHAAYNVKGDATKKINNYESGAGYYFDSKAGYYKDTDPKQVTATLFNSVETKKELTIQELQGLKSKLELAGLQDVKTNALTQDNVYTINTGEETIFVYDPKVEGDNPNNASDQLIIGVATKDSRLYVPKNALPKESAAANNALNNIDLDRGLQPGSTLARKNKESLLNQQRAEAQEVYDQALADKNAAQAALDSYQGSDTARRAALEKAVREANLAEQNAGRAANTVGYNQAALQQQQINSAQTLADPTACASTITNPAAPISTFYCVATLISKVTNIIFKLVSFVAYIAGTLFDYSLELSINSAEFFKKLGVVEITWSFIRDMLNITFIFILLWTAVQMLIGGNTKYNAKQVLARVIIVAILMNFSLFAAKLMVDGSNIVSLKIYEAMKSDSESGNASISERVMNTVGLSALYNISDIMTPDNTKVTSSCANNPGALITVSIMGSIFLIILSLALGLAAILFLVRLVNIIFLFIKSPLWVWGYVLPGNSYASKQKDEWWSQMKHVLMFPIAYLFWMLIAIIIFDSLGTANNDTGGGLLGLICTAPDSQTTGAGATISLVAIFAIVIIFMMKAIEYGVKHSSDGGSNAVGGKFATSISNKFAGYQNAMTRGLAQKAGQVTKGASVGATKVPLRAVTGLAGGINGARTRTGFWKGANDGFSNPGINLKEAAGNFARNQAINGGFVGDITGLNKVAGRLAKKYEDPKNALGETRKQADSRRTAGSVEKQNNIASAIDKKYKIETYDDWKKTKPYGTADEYEKYAENIMEKRVTGLLGKGVAGMKSNYEDPTTGQKLTHLEDLKRQSLTRTVDPTTGEAKVKFSEYDMRSAMDGVLKHKDTLKQITKNKTDLTPFRNIRAAAKIKAVTEANGLSQRKVQGKKSTEEATENLKKATEKLRKKIEELPAETDIKSKIKFDDASSKALYTGNGDNEDTVKAINLIVGRYNAANSTSSPNQTVLDGIQRELEKAVEDHGEFVDKQKAALIKKEREFAAHLEKVKKAEEDAKNK